MSAALTSPPLRIVVEPADDGVVLVAVSGDVDTVSAADLRAALTGALARTGVRRVVVDLTAVPFLAVPGLHPLLEARAAAEATGTTLTVLAAAGGGVGRLLHRAGLAG